ncbi:hypothetical protein [Streptomyces sp. NPDC015125]|uniref:hypothetical protein n=1 Tax=Streptomyces sp. NPDC015125 TaxID=3364938 RepID=UPI0036F839DE
MTVTGRQPIASAATTSTAATAGAVRLPLLRCMRNPRIWVARPALGDSSQGCGAANLRACCEHGVSPMPVTHWEAYTHGARVGQ